jgi:hypothetical protein
VADPFAFPEIDEVRIQASMSLEQTRLMGVPLKLLLLDKAKTEVHPTYREARDPKFGEPQDVHAFVHFNPSKQSLRKIGIDEQRDLVAKLSTAELIDLGIMQHGTTWLIGSRLVFDGDEYDILSCHRDVAAFFTNTNIPFFFVLTALRARRRRTPDSY